jgi:hypothetical protein
MTAEKGLQAKSREVGDRVPGWQEKFLLVTASRSDLERPPSPTKWSPEDSASGLKRPGREVDDSLTSGKVKKTRIYQPIPNK